MATNKDTMSTIIFGVFTVELEFNEAVTTVTFTSLDTGDFDIKKYDAPVTHLADAMAAYADAVKAATVAATLQRFLDATEDA